MNVLFIHNIMAPYRLPIFSELSKHHNLKMFFIQRSHGHRRWRVQSSDLEFNYVVSNGFNIGASYIPINLIYELAINKYDVVIIGESSVEMIPSCLLVVLFKYFRGSKIIVMSERFEWSNSFVKVHHTYNTSRLIFNKYLALLYNNSHAFVACSKKATEHLEGFGIENKKIFTSAQAVFDIQPTYRTEFKKKNRKYIRILTVAYLEDRKGLDCLIKAFRTLNNKDTQLVIAGDGAIRSKLEEMARGYENIIFTGYVAGIAKRELYESADIFSLPSHYETWGLVVNEAMHHGLPVIITDAMGSTDIVDGNGIVIPAGNIDALVEALDYLIQNHDVRINMGNKSREIISSINLAAVTEPFMNAIRYVSQSCKR